MFYTTVKKPYIFRYPYRAAYTKGIVENETRNEEIVRWVASFRRYGLQVLVLFWEAEHGASIYNALVGGGFDRSKIRVIFGTKTNYDFMLNKIKDREKAIVEFQSGDVNILVASGILDEGMDLDSIDAMIMAGGHKAPIRILQRVGRAVRLSKSGLPVVFVVDFADFTNKKLLQHSLERYKHCKREGFRQIKNEPW
jgi:DNA or RNA helicases of superfamily II